MGVVLLCRAWGLLAAALLVGSSAGSQDSCEHMTPCQGIPESSWLSRSALRQYCSSDKRQPTRRRGPHMLEAGTLWRRLRWCPGFFPPDQLIYAVPRSLALPPSLPGLANTCERHTPCQELC